MHLTDEQEAIIHADFEDILLVNAYAGTGKTFTLKEFASRRARSRILYLAFNKSMAREAQEKFSDCPHVHVRTVHSLAFGKVGKFYRERLGNLRALDLVGFIPGKDESAEYYYAHILLTLIREYANSALDMEDFCQAKNKKRQIFQDYYQVRLDPFLDALPRLWDRVMEDTALPFEHDFYLKKYQLSRPRLNYDYILVDEAQDVSGVMIDLVMSQQGTKKVYIGDTFQQIYRWRGAVNSLERLSRRATALYLTKSFRCPDDIARLANTYLAILSAPKPYRGIDKQGLKSRLNGTRTVIGRTNATIFDYATQIAGKNIHFLGGFDSYNFEDLADIARLDKGKKSEARNPFLRRFKTVSGLQEYADMANETDLKTRIDISRKYEDIQDVLHALRQRATDTPDEAEITLTTAHKAKGLEWDRVKLIGDFIDVKKEVVDGLQAGIDEIPLSREELNLLYVSITRSKGELGVPQKYFLSKSDLELVQDFTHIKA